ncbi:MAG: fructosamine kinase family protein [Gammaproteobacteria bacterium]
MKWNAIANCIEQATGRAFNVVTAQPIAGGDINSAYRIESDDGTNYFLKLNRPELLPMFEAESDGLQEIAATRTVSVPYPIASGKTSEHAFLVLEFLGFGSSHRASCRLLGQQLAEMHRIQQPYFGWHRDNTIGSTPQLNEPHDDWPTFWSEQRLGFQLKLAAKNGYGGRLQQSGEHLRTALAGFFVNYHTIPSLLHGDLWAGNSAVDRQGRPVVFDPACYYGDREADLAMTELFGGYSQDFYAAYQDTWPIDPDYRIRKTLYNVYHILNHLNLFGGGYMRQAEHMMDLLLSEL